MTDTAQIARAIAHCESALAGVVVTESLAVQMLKAIHGPLTLTFKVRLREPNKRDLDRLLSLGPTFAQALAVPAVRVGEGVGELFIEVPLPPHLQRTPTGADLAQHTKGLSVAVGLDSLRSPQTVDLTQHGAAVWVGPSRRGKTQSMRASLYSLLRANPSQLAFMILSQKLFDWTDFSQAAGCLGIVPASRAAAALDWAINAMAKRAASSQRGQPVIIIADDLLNLLSADQGLASPLGDISSQGAGLGFHLWIGTQDAGSKRGTGGTAIDNNATARLVYKPANRTAGARATGGTLENVDSLGTGKGDAIFMLDGHAQRIATGWVAPSLVSKLPQGPYKTPWEGTRVKGGAGSGAGSRTVTTPPHTPQPPREAYVTPNVGGVALEPSRPVLVRAAEPARQPQPSQAEPPQAAPEPAAETWGEGQEPEVEPAEPAPEPADQGPAYLPNGARPQTYRLPTNRPPDRGETLFIRYLYATLGSKTKTAIAAYGFKNGITMQYVSQALAKGQTTDERQEQDDRQDD
jgi:hypothetical protein